MSTALLTIRADMDVLLMQNMGDDAAIVAAAKVSTKGMASMEDFDHEAGAGLIGFLMKNRHGTPFEHNSMTYLVSAPICVFREFHRHRIGFCLPGDAKISVGTWKNGQTKKIKDIYRDWKLGVLDSRGRTRLLPSTRNLATRTLNLETGLMEDAHMVDVFESGVKPILRIELSTGHVLRCTAEHQIWSPEGWVKAGDVVVNDILGRQGKVAVGERIGISRALREQIQVWTNAQRAEVIKAVDLCYLCGGVFGADQLGLDHVVPVTENLARALDITNLAPVCKPCHRQKTDGEQQLARRRRQANGVRFEQVVSVRSDGEEMTYDIEMPAPWHNFVADGMIVHNSYNEESGRYKVLEPVFYVPDRNRNLVQQGKPGHYIFVPGTPEQHLAQVERMCRVYDVAYTAYEEALADGIAKEVARMVLPVALYSSMYVTCNARSLMSFLSLRTKHEESVFPSYPMREIEMVAEQIEDVFAGLFPITHGAFQAAGRVSP